ncbi:MAG: hypothetical protein WBQ68_10830 [Terriglobales bacterium]
MKDAGTAPDFHRVFIESGDPLVVDAQRITGYAGRNVVEQAQFMRLGQKSYTAILDCAVVKRNPAAQELKGFKRPIRHVLVKRHLRADFRWFGEEAAAVEAERAPQNLSYNRDDFRVMRQLRTDGAESMYMKNIPDSGRT